jgi:hypothetical protein
MKALDVDVKELLFAATGVGPETMARENLRQQVTYLETA